MKKCPKCEETKDLSLFSKNSTSKDGYQSWCKSCSLERGRIYQQENREKSRARTKSWRSRNLEIAREKGNNWRKNNLEKSAASRGKYRANKIGSVPPWLTDHHWMQIEWYYAAAKMMTETSGIEHHVDHIHPLKGKGFNGLHVPWNLQCIPAVKNRKKHKRLENILC